MATRIQFGLAVSLALVACSPDVPQKPPRPRRTAATPRPAPVEQLLEGKVVGVADGDTIRVLDADKHEFRVRLEGIDSPEKGQPFGDAARDATSRLAFGKQARVRVQGIDDFGRTLGRVEIGALDLNRELVAQGMAWRYKYSHDPALGAAEAEARAARRGLWRDPDPVQPWQWRQANHRPRP